MKKERNPADLTKRNNDARKKEIAELRAELDYNTGRLCEYIDELEVRIVRLEKRKARK